MRQALGNLEPSGGTATGDALDVALRAAQRPVRRGQKPPPAAIVLLSDGKTVRGDDALTIARGGPREDPRLHGGARHATAARSSPSARRQHRTRTEPVPPDPETLKQIAETNGRERSRSTTRTQLDAVYERLGSQLTKRDEQGGHAASAGGALLLVLGGGGPSLRWFGRVP